MRKVNHKKIVLDASALLALLNEEPGYKEVEKALPLAVMSSVNLCEVVSVLTDIGISKGDAEGMVMDVLKEVIPFDAHQALIAASLRKHTKAYGLSLGDRACLALTKSLHATVLTADKIWAKLMISGAHVSVIR
jgi:ribonuclease VapC